MWGQMGSYMGHYGPGWGWQSGSGLLGMLPMLIWWVLLVVAIAMLTKWLFASRSDGRRHRDTRPLEILSERYARGEIDAQEYEKRKRDLRP